MKPMFLLLLAVTFSYCTKLNQENPNVSEIRLLGRYQIADEKNESTELPKELIEISGLTNSSGKNLFANNDEEGIAYEFDYTSGKIINTINLGTDKIKEDFEGIASANGELFLINSGGEIYRFTGEDSNFEKIKTDLSGKNNVEGLCYYSPDNSLLIACKGDPGNNLEDKKAVYSFNLETNELSKEPFLIIDLKELKNNYNIKAFSPSGIAYNSESNSIFIISANDQGLLEVSPEGNILNFSVLPSKLHRQPEAITISDDNLLIIGDEGGSRGKITIYKVE